MPATIELVRALRERGIAAVVSGAGPTVLALGAASRLDALDLATPGWSRHRTALDATGLVVTRPAASISDSDALTSVNVVE